MKKKNIRKKLENSYEQIGALTFIKSVINFSRYMCVHIMLIIELFLRMMFDGRKLLHV